MSDTLFDLPSSPDGFGVILPPSNLRKIDFSGLDYDSSRRAIIEYIKTYFPDDFNDFVAANGVMMICEIIAATTAKLSLRSDLLANESTLPTCKTEEAVVNHLALINQRIRRQTPAIVDIEVTIDQPAFTDIIIDAGVSFGVQGVDGSIVTYEVYKAPGDWTGKIVIPAGKRGVIAYGLEGKFSSDVSFTSDGSINQEYVVQDINILELPILVNVVFGSYSENWRVIYEPIERFGAADKVVEVNFIDNTARFRFGDNITGLIPSSGSIINVRYRVGGGARGRIGIGQIDTIRQYQPLPPANVGTSVRFRNISSSVGGVDRETIDRARKRAPRDYALQRSIVTANDYAQAAANFNHPVYGSISKSIATIRTSKNANLVEIYALANGSDSIPVAPNAGLKLGLTTYFNDLQAFTNTLVILDGKIKPVDIEVTVIINRTSDASLTKVKVEAAIDSFFDISKWEMGYPFYISHFISAIENIDGVAYIDLFNPVNNIIPSNNTNIADTGVRFNELIVAGKRIVNYYYERNQSSGGSRI